MKRKMIQIPRRLRRSHLRAGRGWMALDTVRCPYDPNSHTPLPACGPINLIPYLAILIQESPQIAAISTKLIFL
jgi:hypothetical protein